MQSVNYLMKEHRLIERGLDLLEKSVALIEANQSLPEGFVQWVPDFFMNFADGCHHAKEEDVFFPALKENGIPVEGGPIGVMLYEHELGRDCNRRMREAGESNPFNGSQFSDAAVEFIPLLRQHIFKEDNVLFKMAANVISLEEDSKLVQMYGEVEKERGLDKRYQKYEADIIRWEEVIG